MWGCCEGLSVYQGAVGAAEIAKGPVCAGAFEDQMLTGQTADFGITELIGEGAAEAIPIALEGDGAGGSIGHLNLELGVRDGLCCRCHKYRVAEEWVWWLVAGGWFAGALVGD